MNPSPKYFQHNVIHKVSQFMNSDKLAPRTTKFVLWALLGKTSASCRPKSTEQSLVNKALVIPRCYAARA